MSKVDDKDFFIFVILNSFTALLFYYKDNTCVCQSSARQQYQFSEV